MNEAISGTRPSALDEISRDRTTAPLMAQPSKASTGWKTELVRRWRWVAGGSLIVLSLCGTTALMNGSSSEIRGRSGSVTPDKQALLTLTEQDFEALDAQVDLQLDESYKRLITLEAVRFLAEAEKQSTDSSKPCYRLGSDCVLDQFEQDAFSQYRQGADELDRAIQIQALIRLQIVDTARTGVRVAPEPDNALTAAAIQKRLEARQIKRQASAESIAADILED